MSDKVDFEIFKRFGPSILKVKIPENIINNLNNYVDQTISDDKKIQKQNLGEGLVGDVTQEFSLEQDIMEKTGWGNFLASCVSNWINMEMKKKITKFKIRKSWIVRQFKNEYNPTHWHSGHISGAGFLKVPNTFGKHVQNKQNRVYRGGNLQLIHGSKMFLCESTFTIIPKVGDFYFFPNYMMHTVFPFKDTNEERRSISFNADIDNEIYNVYGE
jgi:hypothetical protein